MKKLLYTLTSAAALCLCCGTAHAANGDISGTIYSTDILTQCNHYDIQGYAIDGRTLITLEDLRFFGYNVNYVDSERTLYIDFSGQTSYPSLEPTIRGTVGDINGYYYESDIKAYVNGKYIKSYALDGTSAVIAEELGSVDYGFSYDYDDSKRLLSLISLESPMPYNSLFGTIYHPNSADTGNDGIVIRFSVPDQEAKSYSLVPRAKQYGGLASVKAVKLGTDELKIYADEPINGSIRLAYTNGAELSETPVELNEITEHDGNTMNRVYKFKMPISDTGGFLNLYIGDLYNLSMNILSWDASGNNGFHIHKQLETEDYTILLGSRRYSRYNSLLYVIPKNGGTTKELLSLLSEHEPDLGMAWSCGIENLSIDASGHELYFECEYPNKNIKCKYNLDAGELTTY